MPTILVTGAAGFIGSNFVRHWRTAHPGDRIVAVDLLTYAGNRPNLSDVEDGDRVRCQKKPMRANGSTSSRSS